MKMSDVFELPVDFRQGIILWFENQEWTSVGNPDFINHAINQHDQLVEVLIELVTAPDHCSEGYRDSLRKAKQLLEKEHDY